MEERKQQQQPNPGPPQENPTVPAKEQQAVPPAPSEPERKAPAPERPVPAAPKQEQQPPLASLAAPERKQPQGEPQETFSRRDIRTMEKDLAEIREQEASHAQDRISQVKPESDSKKKQEPAPRIEEDTLIPGQDAFGPAAAASPKSKLAIRLSIAGAFLIVLAGIGAGAYLFFTREREEPAPVAQEEQAPAVSEPQREPEPRPSPVPVAQSLTIQVAPQEEVLLLVEEVLPQLENGFTRIALRDTETGAFLDPKPGLLVTPEEILHRESILLGYTIPGRTHLALLLPLNEEVPRETLAAWEETSMEEDLASFMNLQGSRGTAASSFRSATYRDIDIRFLALSQQDFGIVYAQLNRHLVITGSLESMQRIIDNLIL